MKKVCVIALWLLIIAMANGGTANGQAMGDRALRFDLSKIGLVLNGEQICDDTNPRLQDIPSRAMDQIIAAGPQAIPVLIRMLSDARMAQTNEPIICYWPGMSIGDLAFCLLVNLFTDTSGKTTVPGAGWNDMLGPDGKVPAWEQLQGFVRKNGSAALQAKWRRVWEKYPGQVSWDPKEKCFKFRAGK